MSDKRRDSGEYYPGGRVIARPGTAPQQVVVQWSDVQGKPQIAPLPDRYREDDMKGKINEIASKFATVVLAALIGWTAIADITVQKKRKDQIYNDEQVVVDVTGIDVGVDTNAVREIIRDEITPATNRLNQTLSDALDAHAANAGNPHKVTAAQIGAVPLVEDGDGDKTAVTIGSRYASSHIGLNSLANGNEVDAPGLFSHAEGNITTASGYFSHAEGDYTTASGEFSHAEGSGTTASGNYSHAEGVGTIASGNYSHAEGILSQTRAEDLFAFAWNGDDTRSTLYTSHGPGTFNINPVGGLGGFYIGEQTLYAILTTKADKADISATNPTFSNAVLAVTTNTIRREVSAALNTYVDGETGVEYVGKFHGGSLYYVPTGNVYPPNN